MTLEPKILIAQPYVDGTPDPSERPDQKSIQWMYIGECLGAAVDKGQNGGELNRAGVQIQINSATHRENEKIITQSLGEIITEVNRHDVLLGEIGDVNLVTKVNDMDVVLRSTEDIVVSNGLKISALESGLTEVVDGLGSKGVDTTTRQLYPDVTWIKDRIGSDRDQDYNGEATATPQEPTGMYYRFNEQGKVINSNIARITTLERKIQDEDINKIKTDLEEVMTNLGPSSSAPAAGVYEWINQADDKIDQNIQDIIQLKSDVVMPDNTPLKDAITDNTTKIQETKTALDNHITLNWLVLAAKFGDWTKETSMSADVLKSEEDITALKAWTENCDVDVRSLKTEIGDDATPTSIKGTQVIFKRDLDRYKQSVANLSMIVGSRPAIGTATGLTGEVVEAKSTATQALAATVTNSAQIDTKIGDVADDGKVYVRKHGTWIDTNLTYSNGGFNSKGNTTGTDLPAGEAKKAVLGDIVSIGTQVKFEVDSVNKNLKYKGTSAGFFEIKVSMYIMCPGAQKVDVKLYINGTEADHQYTIPHWNQDQTAHIFYPFYTPLNPDDAIEVYLQSDTTQNAVVSDCVVYAKEL